MRLFRQSQHGDWAGVVGSPPSVFRTLHCLISVPLCKPYCQLVTSFNQQLSDEDVFSLVRRMELKPKLLCRYQEEQIIALVPIESLF